MFYQTFLLYKLLLSLNYPYNLDYKRVLLATLSTSYKTYQSLLYGLSKFLALRRTILTTDRKIFRRKILVLTTKEKFSTPKKNSQGKRKPLKTKEKFSRQKKNCQGKRKTLKAKEKFSWQKENSEGKRKILTTIKNTG